MSHVKVLRGRWARSHQRVMNFRLTAEWERDRETRRRQARSDWERKRGKASPNIVIRTLGKRIGT